MKLRAYQLFVKYPQSIFTEACTLLERCEDTPIPNLDKVVCSSICWVILNTEKY